MANLELYKIFIAVAKEKNIKAGKLLGMNEHILDYEKYGVDELIKDLKANGVNAN